MATYNVEILKDVWLDGHGAVRLSGSYLTKYHCVIGHVLKDGSKYVLANEQKQRMVGDDGEPLAPHRSRPSAVMKLVDVVVNRPETGSAAEHEEAPEDGSDWNAVLTKAAMEHSAERVAAREPDAVLRRLTGAADVFRHREPDICELMGDARDLITRLRAENADLKAQVERLKDAAMERSERDQ